jgi:hypothetical protein
VPKHSLYKENMQMTSSEKEFLKSLLQASKSYLEIGSGYSTIWSSQFVENLHSVECRSVWYNKIKQYLDNENITNASIFLQTPEPCAFDSDGSETWSNQTSRGDYGTLNEFKSYYSFIINLVRNNNYDIILVDGNIRVEIVFFLVSYGYSGKILVHDVVPERHYLNSKLFTMVNLKTIKSVDGLFQFEVIK